MDLDFQRTAHILEKREARYRRSKKLGRILFYVFMVSATATFRLNPELVADIAAYTGNAPVTENKVAALERETHLPKDRVKVRRGIGNDQTITPQNSKELAQDVEQALSKIKVGQ